jgi:hypothetical protein
MVKMDYGGRLALTGPGIVIGSLVINQAWLLVAGIGMFLLGISCVRLGWRRDKQVDTP